MKREHACDVPFYNRLLFKEYFILVKKIQSVFFFLLIISCLFFFDSFVCQVLHKKKKILCSKIWKSFNLSRQEFGWVFGNTPINWVGPEDYSRNSKAKQRAAKCHLKIKIKDRIRFSNFFLSSVFFFLEIAQHIKKHSRILRLVLPKSHFTSASLLSAPPSSIWRCEKGKGTSSRLWPLKPRG